MRLQFLENKNVVRVAAGAYHTLFLTDFGELYSAGLNANGQLGGCVPVPLCVSVSVSVSVSVPVSGSGSVSLSVSVSKRESEKEYVSEFECVHIHI